VEREAELEAFRDPLGTLEEQGGEMCVEQLARRFREQPQPMLEMPRLDAGQLAAHLALIKTLGAAAIWGDYREASQAL